MTPSLAPTNITTFIFDCFGVVCEPAMYGWYRDHRLVHGFIDENLEAVFREFDLGNVSEEEIVTYFSKYEGVGSPKEKIAEEIDGYLKIDVGLVLLIKKLRRNGFKTALLSNANHTFFDRKVYTTYPEFKNLFDEIVISSAVGMVKPNADIYEYTLEKMNSAAAESLFIDDSAVNVEAAIRLGMKGFLYTEADSFTQHLPTIGIRLDEQEGV